MRRLPGGLFPPSQGQQRTTFLQPERLSLASPQLALQQRKKQTNKEAIQCPGKVEGKATSSNSIELTWKESPMPQATRWRWGGSAKGYSTVSVKEIASSALQQVLSPTQSACCTVCGSGSISEWSEVAEVKSTQSEEAKGFCSSARKPQHRTQILGQC